MHIGIVANCQARAVASLVKALNPAVRDVSTVIVHLAKKDFIEDDYALLDKADFIFAQFVTDQYFAGHLATARLKDRYGTRLISWPNIFFRGQTPDLAYASVNRAQGPSSGRLLGPLREYHHRGIFRAWHAGMSVSECLTYLSDCQGSFREEALAIAQRSLDELRKRETPLDTTISDLIKAEWRQRRLFFTFNHPTAYLLSEMAKRLLLHAGLTATGYASSEREPLDLVIPPVFDRDAELFGSALGKSDMSRGAELIIEGNIVQQGAVRFYTHPDLIETTFRAYDAQLFHEDVVAFSPL